MRIFRTIPMPFLAFTGAVVCSSKKIGEPYFCYYRLLPQVAQTYRSTRNLSDSPFLEKGGLRTIHPTCMQLALPSRLSQQYKKLESKRAANHTSYVYAIGTLPRKPKIDTSPIPVRRTWRFQKCCRSVSSLRTNRGNVSNDSGSEAIS